MTEEVDARLAARLAVLRERYVARLPEKLDALRAALAAFEADPGPENHAALRTLAHKLHGTGGSYGLAEVSAAAGRLEQTIVDAGAAGFDPQGRARAQESLDELARLAAQRETS